MNNYFNKMIRRRFFLKLILISFSSGLLAFFALDFRRVVRSMLFDDTKQLRFADEKIIDQFLSDADREYFWNQFSAAKKIFISIQHLFHSVGVKLPYHFKYLQYRSVISGQLMFSTDLFTRGTYRDQPLRYLRFFNPYKTVCSNPFSNVSV